jgi:23S rRNA pseudouridine1911/1915/1917 synthase
MNDISHSLSIPEEQAGRRLDQALAELLPDYSRSRIKEWILGGCVLLDGAVASRARWSLAGQQVELQATVAARATVAAQDVPFEVVHEDDAVLVVLKPAGLVVHPGAGNPDATLENGLRRHAPALAALPRSGLLHRLDKDTSGLVLVARTLAAHTHLTRDLQERRDHARVPRHRQRRDDDRQAARWMRPSAGIRHSAPAWRWTGAGARR